MPTATFEIYQDVAGRYRWLLRDDARVVASSGESFDDEKSARRDTERLALTAAKATVTVEAA